MANLLKDAQESFERRDIETYVMGEDSINRRDRHYINNKYGEFVCFKIKASIKEFPDMPKEISDWMDKYISMNR